MKGYFSDNFTSGWQSKGLPQIYANYLNSSSKCANRRLINYVIHYIQSCFNPQRMHQKGFVKWSWSSVSICIVVMLMACTLIIRRPYINISHNGGPGVYQPCATKGGGNPISAERSISTTRTSSSKSFPLPAWTAERVLLVFPNKQTSTLCCWPGQQGNSQ